MKLHWFSFLSNEFILTLTEREELIMKYEDDWKLMFSIRNLSFLFKQIIRDKGDEILII